MYILIFGIVDLRTNKGKRMFIKRRSFGNVRRTYVFPYILADTFGTGPLFWKVEDIPDQIDIPKTGIPDVFGVDHKFADFTSLGSNKYLDGTYFELSIAAHTLEVHMPDGDWDVLERSLSEAFCLEIR